MQEAAEAAARGRAARARGDLRTARVLEQRACKLMDVARSVQVPERDRPR